MEAVNPDGVGERLLLLLLYIEKSVLEKYSCHVTGALFYVQFVVLEETSAFAAVRQPDRHTGSLSQSLSLCLSEFICLSDHRKE